MKKLTLTLIVFISPILLLFPLTSNAERPSPDVFSVFEDMQEQIQENSQSKQPEGGIVRFSWRDLWLDIPPDTVLATSQGDALVYVDEFNQRAMTTYGEDLFQARHNALRKIIDTKLVAVKAREAGFKNDPLVIKKVSRAGADLKITGIADQYKDEISYDQAWRYYKKHIEEFKQADKGTRVLFVVKGERKEAQEILERIKKGEPIEKFSFSSKPIPGSRLPEAVREKIFHLEPNHMTDLIVTPIGIYIAKLKERNAFDHFKVSIIVKNNLQQCQKILGKIKSGEKFEALVADKGQLWIDLKDLPQEVKMLVPDMELDEISQPISTSLGFFLVKLKEHRSYAQIITAKLIRADSKTQGEKISSRLKKGLDLDQVHEREIAGKDLPGELLDVAQTLKEAEYSGPVKTNLGYYLVKIQQRVRQIYEPFEKVREEIEKMIKAETISNNAAFNYYNSNRSFYRQSGPAYILDIILAESSFEGEKIFSKLQKTTDLKKKESLFAKYQKELGSVSARMLPPACQGIAGKLKPGRLSPVIPTRLGYFILRMHEKVDVAYRPFEDVKHDIKSFLFEQTRKQDKRETAMYLTQAEESALTKAYYKANVLYVDEVSDEEVEEWWQETKNEFNLLGIPELKGDKIEFDDPQTATRFKKVNFQLNRYKMMLKELYNKNNVIIYENLLSQ